MRQRLCGRNWTEDPVQRNSDLWAITCNVLRQRAVSGHLSDSINPTQRSAVHSFCLNCPICFPLGAQLLLQPVFPPLVTPIRSSRITYLLAISHRRSSVWLVNVQTSTLQSSYTCNTFFRHNLHQHLQKGIFA